MSKEYKIKQVSPEQKQWSSQYGDMVTYYIKIEGEEDEPVQINKKAESPEPKEGDDLYGDITDTQFGMKFKSAKRSSGSGGYQKSASDKEDIARAVALKAAVEWATEYKHGPEEERIDETLELAGKFLAWLKGGKPSTEPENASESENKRDWQKVGKPKDKDEADDERAIAEYESVRDNEQINLDDIPF